MPHDAELRAAAEAYFEELRRVRASGGATAERSRYTALANLLDGVGGGLKPKVALHQRARRPGRGPPRLRPLRRRSQLRRGDPREGQLPERGVVEVKAITDDAWLTAEGDQVSRYWEKYRLVLVTNFRDFVLLGEDAEGRPAKLETIRLAGSAEDFEHRLIRPRAFARDVGVRLGEYLTRALSHSATITDPKDLAVLLASYARDGLARVEAAGSRVHRWAGAH